MVVAVYANDSVCAQTENIQFEINFVCKTTLDILNLLLACS